MSNHDHLKDPVVQAVVRQNLAIAIARLELALGGNPAMSGSQTIQIGVKASDHITASDLLDLPPFPVGGCSV